MDTKTRKEYAMEGKMMHGVFFEFWVCKCGEVEEVSVCEDIEWYVCKKCGRRGSWMKQGEEPSNIPGISKVEFEAMKKEEAEIDKRQIPEGYADYLIDLVEDR